MAEPEMHHWIRFWFKRNDREFAEEAKRQLDRLAIEKGISPIVMASCARMDRGTP